MGVTIHYKMAQKVGYIKKNIDDLEAVCNLIKTEQADKLGIGFDIDRRGPHSLFINIDGCETLAFDFKPMSEHLKEYETYSWHPFDSNGCMQFENEHQGAHYETWPEQKLVWSSEFCKTQFARNLVSHKWVADLVKYMASRACFASVYDEGDYYHTNEIEDARESIKSNGALIDSLGAMLGGMGYETKKGGETSIK